MLWTADTVMYRGVSMDAAYSGSTLIWRKTITGDYLTVEVVSGGTIGLQFSGFTTQMSINGGSFSQIGNRTLTVSAGDIIRFRGTDSVCSDGAGAAGSGTHTGINDGTAKFKVKGNIMSLFYGDDFEGKTSFKPSYSNDRQLYRFFDGCSGLIDASELKLPVVNLTRQCYWALFYKCTSLVTPPTLPSHSLAEGCYEKMFSFCTSLSTAPQLPATTLAESCYHTMFVRCTSLTSLPALPATTMVSHCYYAMFQDCSALTTIPSNYLPAMTLAMSCYEAMFEGCTGITSAPTLPATSMADACYADMFRFTGLVQAPALPSTNLAERCYLGMFMTCRNLTNPPELPATTLEKDCYHYMFSGCTALVTASTLPAPTLVRCCYDTMFTDCSSLKYVTCLATDISAPIATDKWLRGVSSSGRFTKASSMSDWTRGEDGIPTGWTIRNA